MPFPTRHLPSGFWKVAAAFCMAALMAACGRGGKATSSSVIPASGASGIIVLSPMGSAASPANESILSSFVLTASEAGYSGNFTAQTIVGTCWVVKPPTTAVAAFVVSPSGLLCVGGFNGDTEQIKVTDGNGNSTITYIHSV